MKLNRAQKAIVDAIFREAKLSAQNTGLPFDDEAVEWMDSYFDVIEMAVEERLAKSGGDKT